MLSGLLVIILGVVFAFGACSSDAFVGSMEEKKTAVSADFNEINITIDTADVDFVLTSDGNCKTVAYDRKKIRYDVTVENGTLKIETVDERRWFERIFSFGGASLTVYLPKSEYDTLTIDASTGDVIIPKDFKLGNIDIDLSTGDAHICASAADSVKIKGSTGDVIVKDISCGSLEVKISTGVTELSGVTASGNIDIECSTGYTELSNVSCNNLTSIGDTGDVKATNITASNNVSIERSTGNVDVDEINTLCDLSVKTDTGKIELSDADCLNLELEVTTGKCNLSDISCQNFNSTGDTGDIYMTNLIASGKINIERSTGDVRFNRCDASELEVETDTGDVKGSLLTEKVFVTRTSTGKIDVPETTTGGKCKITTSTGDIKIEIAE
jgi:DUF4097 and DUF4098 domain-containing protein YvlB